MQRLAAPRGLTRFQIALAVDLAMAAISLPLALALTDPLLIARAPFGIVAVIGLGFALVALVPLLLLRVPWRSWRYFGSEDGLRIALAAAIACAAHAGLNLLAGGWRPFSPMAPAVQAIVLTLLWISPRLAWRRFRNRGGTLAMAAPERLLLAGADDGADLFLRAIASDPRVAFEVVGLLANDPKARGRLIHDRPVLGTLADAKEVLEDLAAGGQRPAAIVVTSPAIDGARMARLLDAAEAAGVAVRRMPRLTHLDLAAHPGAGTLPSAGSGPAQDGRLELRPIAIEDLLNRPPVDLDREAMARLVSGRRVLVTGAGGTIGGELARQIASFGPASLTLVEVSEFALYEIDLAIREGHPDLPREAVLADIRDRERMLRVMAAARPELVFHAAALKHVPLVEDNPLEGILTNAVGTRNVADAARAAEALVVVLISTDKAVNPSSVMGATKRLAEMYFQALDARRAAEGGAGKTGGTRFVTVRFGNVLGSTGSVVPLFRRQLERGGPLTVTHPDMQRYFMTVAEAASLVLAASALAAEDGLPDPARSGGIVVLDMGVPVRIVDLARQMIRLAGLRPEVDVAIRFTGLRPGEKLEEELFHTREPHVPAGRPGLLAAAPRTAELGIVARALDSLAASARGADPAAALAQLSVLVPEFRPPGPASRAREDTHG
ncbi:MAG: polysaccharide biosynthesis protein [Acetobacteraceae bacterium]|nr:polysaccharide biosynthesis protein [Acetobacteraceae bacterium]